MKIFNYSVAPPSDSVVVLAGGPSTSRNREQIKDYISKHNSVVFAANYNYGIHANYTYFTDMRKLAEQKNAISTDVILRVHGFLSAPKKIRALIPIIEQKFNVYFAGSKDKSPSVYRSNRVEIMPDGSFPYYTLGAAGFGCILLGLMCRPKRILFTGIDGPIVGTDKKEMFDGSIAISDIHKDPKIIRFFTNSLFPTLKDMNICVETYEDVYFYGLDKSQFGINVI